MDQFIITGSFFICSSLIEIASPNGSSGHGTKYLYIRSWIETLLGDKISNEFTDNLNPMFGFGSPIVPETIGLGGIANRFKAGIVTLIDLVGSADNGTTLGLTKDLREARRAIANSAKDRDLHKINLEPV